MFVSGDRVLSAELVRLEREMRALEARMLDVLHEAERTGAHQADGHRTLGAWCRASVKWSRGETTARVQASRLVAEEPEVRHRVEAGDLGVAQVRVLARARANPRCGDQLTDVLPLLLDVEPTLTFEEFRTVVERWEQLADADGAHRDAEHEHARRGLWWRPTRHGIDGRFRLAGAGAAEFVAVLEAFTAAELQTDLEAARLERGAEPSPLGALARTGCQRRADALVTALAQGASIAPGGDLEPTVNIVIDEATFNAALATAATGRRQHVEQLDPVFARCETTQGVRVDPLEAVAAALAGHVRRVVVDQAGVVIDLGRRSRLFTGASREAVWLLRRLCVWVGCDITHGDVDHLTPWDEGGTTDPHNGGMHCKHHHRFKHRHGYRTWRDQRGVWHLFRADGSEIRPI